MQTNIIYNEDCIGSKGIKRLPDKSIDMILADMPYGTTACKWDTIIPFEPLWEQLKRVIKPNGAIILTASQPFTSNLLLSNLKQFKYELIWDKNYGGSPGLAKYRPMPSHENILVFGNGKLNYIPQMRTGKPYIDKRIFRKTDKPNYNKNEHKFGYKKNVGAINSGTRFPLSVIRIQKHNTKGQHPTQKPVALFEYLIKTYTNEGEVVLDFAIGSGTTAVACKRLNRKYIGFETDKKYFNIAIERLEAEKTLWD